jgi:hypothetical protein
MSISKSLATSSLVVAASIGLAAAQMPDGSVYVLHSGAHGGCPSLDWYVVVEARGNLAGMIAWNDMKIMTKAIGIVDRPHRTFTMTATEIGGQARVATIEGEAHDDGRLVAHIRGPSITCTAVAIPMNKVQPGADHR